MQARLDLLEEGAVEVVDVIETREKQFAQVVGHEIVAVDGVAKPLHAVEEYNYRTVMMIRSVLSIHSQLSALRGPSCTSSPSSAVPSQCSRLCLQGSAARNDQVIKHHAQ